MGGIFAASRTRETLHKRFRCTKVNLTFPFKQRSSFISENDQDFPAVAYSVLFFFWLPDCWIPIKGDQSLTLSFESQDPTPKTIPPWIQAAPARRRNVKKSWVPLLCCHLVWWSWLRVVGYTRSTTQLIITIKLDMLYYITLPETNIAPENRPSQKETSLPTIHLQGLC